VHDDVPVSSANLKANEQGRALTDPSNIIGGPPDMVCPYYFFGFLILDVRSGVFRLANGACQMSDDLAILQVRKDGAKVYSTGSRRSGRVHGIVSRSWYSLLRVRLTERALRLNDCASDACFRLR
jgi:hypothetical protein